MKKIIWLMTIPIVLLLISACSATVKIDQNKNGQDVSINQGDILKVTLESNPTTGYSWIVSEQSSTPGLVLQTNQYQPEKTDQDLVGSGGVQVFVFEAESSGRNTIIIDYQREWEEQPVDSFKLEVTVK